MGARFLRHSVVDRNHGVLFDTKLPARLRHITDVVFSRAPIYIYSSMT